MVHVQFGSKFHFVMNFSKGSKTNVTKICTGVGFVVLTLMAAQSYLLDYTALDLRRQKSS
jgi:hypothetical protein